LSLRSASRGLANLDQGGEAPTQCIDIGLADRRLEPRVDLDPSRLLRVGGRPPALGEGDDQAPAILRIRIA
jgi:hypothetical protein